MNHHSISVPIRQDRREAVARARAYAVFSRLFSYPSDEGAPSILDGSLFVELRQALLDLPHAGSLGAWDWPSLPVSAEELQACYCRLFEASRPSGASVSLNEKDYVSDERSQVWEDILRFYEHFGIEYSANGGMEMPDHLVTELDFLHYLSFLEVGAEGNVEDFSRARADFLSRHPAKWVTGLGERLARAEDGAPYAGFAGLLKAFVAGEVGRAAI